MLEDKDITLFDSEEKIDENKKNDESERNSPSAASHFIRTTVPRNSKRSLTQPQDFFEVVKSNNVSLIKKTVQTLFRHSFLSENYLQLVNNQGENGLIVAVCEKAYLSIKFLLSEGISVDARDYLGRTALHWAVLNNDIQSAELLLAYHASLNCKDSEGFTPVMLAKMKKYNKILSRFSEVINYNYHAEKLTLHKNVEALTDGEDTISEVSYRLQPYLAMTELEAYRNALENIFKQLLQPEELLCAQTESLNRRSALTSFGKKTEKSEKKAILGKSLSYSEISKENFASLILTDNSNVFGNINKLIADIDNFNLAITEKKNESLVEISGLLRKAKQCYLRFRVEVCQSEGRRRIELCSGRARMRGFLGFRYLNSGATVRFNSFFNPEEVKEQLLPHKDNVFGTHAVLQLRDTFYKIRPTAPGVEHAFCSLNNIISGQGSAPTELLVFEKGQNAFPVLASKAVNGENFAKVLEEHPEWVDKIDSFNYTAHVMLTLLACPSDVKPDNYMVIIEQDETNREEVSRIKLIGIDNDLAFDPPYMAVMPFGKKTTQPNEQHFLDLKAVFFCMNQVNQVLDPGFRQTFLKQSPELIILKWLKELLLQENRYLQYRKMPGVVAEDIQNAQYIRAIFTEEEFKKIRVPLKLLPGTIQSVYERLQKIQSLMKHNAKLTHAGLLKEIYPALSACYEHARAKESDIFDRIQYVYSGFPNVEDVPGITHIMLQELKKYTHTVTAVSQERTETLSEAAIKFINSLDYKSIEHHTQGYIIEKIISDFSSLKNFIFRQAEALTDERLCLLAQGIKKIDSLELIKCSNIDGAGLSAILCQHPDIQLSLEGFESISSLNLLSLLQHCRDLVLILDGEKYTLKSSEDSGKMLKHALQNEAYSSLVTALLLSGAHLGFGQGYQSPLHMAIKENKETVVRELIRYGASVNQLNEEGKSPLDIAIEGYETSLNEKQSYQNFIFMLLTGGAIETKYAARILEVLPKVAFPPKAAEHIFTFVRCHNLLTPDWVEQLIPSDLTELDLSPPKTFNFAAISLTEELLEAIRQRVPNLKKLNIQGCTGLTMALFFKKILSWKLDTIDMGFDQVSKCGLATLDKLQDCASLLTSGVSIRITHLILSGQKFTPDQLLKLGTFIRKNIHLKKIELVRCQLSLNEIKIIAGAFGQNKSLESICLNRNPLGDEGASILLNALEQNKQSRLLELLLEETGASVKSAKVVGALLKDHPCLEILSLYKNPLGDDGIEVLAKGLQARSQSKEKKEAILKQLTLNDVGMGEQGAYSLSQALFFLKTLVYLDVGYNPLGDAGALCFVPLLELNSWLIEFKCGGLSNTRIQQFDELIKKNRQHCQKWDLQAISLESQPLWQQRVTPILPLEYIEIENLQSQNASLRQQLLLARQKAIPGKLFVEIEQSEPIEKIEKTETIEIIATNTISSSLRGNNSPQWMGRVQSESNEKTVRAERIEKDEKDEKVYSEGFQEKQTFFTVKGIDNPEKLISSSQRDTTFKRAQINPSSK